MTGECQCFRAFSTAFPPHHQHGTVPDKVYRILDNTAYRPPRPEPIYPGRTRLRYFRISHFFVLAANAQEGMRLSHAHNFPEPLHTLQLLPFLSTPVPATLTARHRRCTCRKLRAVGNTQADRSGAPERWIRTYREEQAMPDTPLHWRTALAASRRSEQPARRKQMNNAFPS